MSSRGAAFTINRVALRHVHEHSAALHSEKRSTSIFFYLLNRSHYYSNFDFILFNCSTLRDLHLCRHTNSEFTCSLSSMWLRSRPLAWAIRFPATRFPTITEAGPTSATNTHTIFTQHSLCNTNTSCSITHIRACAPGCFCLGLGRLVMQEWGHMRMLQGCSAPSRNSCLVSDRCIPPRGVLGRVLAGTNARQ